MIQTTRCSSVLCLMVLLAVQTRYADADVEPLKIELNPSDYVPLAVGNRWTYEHFYWNNSYPHGGWSGWNLEDLKPLEIPSYPHGWDNPMPPDSLTTVKRILTIEITHTEMIDGLEYFVFSSDDYAWPPLPEFFWGGKKVRLSAEGFLVFRWNGQDVPLYDFGHHHHLDAPNSYKYVTHEYGVTLPGEFIAANIGFGRGMEFYFDGLRIEGSEFSSLYDLSKVFFTFEYLGEAVWRNFFCDFL